MNKIKFTYFKIITSIFLILFFISCNNIEPNEVILGEWTMTSITTNQDIVSENGFAKAVEEITTTTTLIFKADKTFSGKIWGDTTYGIWNIEENGTVLNIFDEQSNYKIRTKLIFISDTKISLIEIQDSMAIKMNFMKKKNN